MNVSQYAWIEVMEMWSVESTTHWHKNWINFLLQVDLEKVQLISGVMSRGDPAGQGWVTWYYVYVSVSCTNFQPIIDREELIAVSAHFIYMLTHFCAFCATRHDMT